jgi:multiple sugar transport system permease protein
VLFVTHEFFPLLWSLGLSFYAYQSSQQSIRFVGVANYARLLTDDLKAPELWTNLTNTAMFTVLTVSAQMIVGFLLAIMFAKQFPLRRYLLILVLTPMMLRWSLSVCSFPVMTRHSAISQTIKAWNGEQFILFSARPVPLRHCFAMPDGRPLCCCAGWPRVGSKYLWAALLTAWPWRRFWTTFPMSVASQLALLFAPLRPSKWPILHSARGRNAMAISTM